jgi:ABC-type antimicrobial peptide transport system permease subunit
VESNPAGRGRRDKAGAVAPTEPKTRSISLQSAPIRATAATLRTPHPTTAWAGGLVAAIVIGASARLLPAIRAARMSPTEALRTV